MYAFIDVNESAGANKLPAEAVSINGEYIENLITGYRTLYTIGRESLEKEFENYSDTAQNGSITKFTRFPSRTITVGFQLLSSSTEAFRDAFNQLNGILNSEDAEIIFADEDDKFFTGSPVMNAEVNPGAMSVTGEYQIYCQDPFKYSTEWFEPQAVFDEEDESGLAQTFLIDYEGTVPAYPQYIAKFYDPDGETDEDNAEETQTDLTKKLGNVGSCKYVAFMDANRHVLQFGNPDLEDDTEIPDPLILTNRSFKKKGAYDASVNGEEWESPAKGYSVHTKTTQQGSVGSKAAVYSAAQQTITKDQVLLAVTAGTDCKYKATVTQVDSRTSSTVKLHIQVKMTKLSSAITKGATLTVECTCGDKTVTKVLKKSSVSWSKGTTHSVSFTMTVSASSTKKELSGIKLKVTRTNSTYKSGSKTKTATGSTGKLASKTCKVIEIPYYIQIGVNSYYACPTSYGNAVAGYFTGPTMTWTYPSSGLPDTDVSDGKGAKSFDLTWNMKFCIGKTTNETLQMGAFDCLLLTGDSMDANGDIVNQKILAGVRVVKTNTTSKGSIYLYVAGSKKYESLKNIDLSWANGAFGNKSGLTSCKINSTGKKINFTLGKTFNKGKTKTFSIPKSYQNKRVFKIVFGFYRYGANPAFDWIGINAVKFRKIYTTETELEATPFSAGQTLVADTAECDVLIDDVSTPSVGALGNDWETMCLSPGVNQISTAYEQREEDAVKVVRRCRSDETYQGIGAYEVDDEGYTVAIEASDVKQYYTCAGMTTEDLFFCTEENDDAVTASGFTFNKVEVDADAYDADPTGYFVLESTIPTFSVRYREVYL